MSKVVRLRAVKGFSLVELVLVVGIIAIMASLAYPPYAKALLKSHRSDAIIALAQAQIQLERCYARHFSYKVACPTLPKFPQASTQGYYNITLSNLSRSTYTLKAVATGFQAQDGHCLRFSVNQTNEKTAWDNLGKPQSECWG